MQQEHQQLFNSSVLEQQALIPEIYGSVDFGQLPERYVKDFDLETLRPSRHRHYCERVLENPELVERIRNYTMMGDKVADAYASLIPEYGFRALVSMLERACDEGIESPAALALSKQQFWWAPRGTSESAVKLHRARQFTCYADIPGVGGGRDIPYTRYDNLNLHDQGAETWFVDKDGRNLGLRLFNVDWPINNYDGYFTRDSLVIYVIEKLDDGSTKEHGYAFTLPEANRIGINLKWLLASCFMISGKVDTPTM